MNRLIKWGRVGLSAGLLLLLSSCFSAYHAAWIDEGREGEAVMISHGNMTKIARPAEVYKNDSYKVTLYRAGSKYYVQGERCTTLPFRFCSWYTMLDDLTLARSHSVLGQYLKTDSDVEYRTVYGEVQLCHSEDGQMVWKRIDSPWLETLPAKAKRYKSSYGYCFDNPVRINCKGSEFRIAEQTVAPHANERAWYAYPMAAVTLVALDLPTYILYHIPHAIVFPFSAVQQQQTQVAGTPAPPLHYSARAVRSTADSDG